MESFMFTSAPRGCELKELPALSAEKGAARLAILRQLVGAQGPKAAKDAGFYLLEDKLALQMKLQGLTLAKAGEVPALSPARWKEGEGEANTPGNARGLVLEPAAAKRFRAFLRANGAGRGSASALDLIHLARHFFYEEAIKIVVPTRTPV